MKRQILFFMVIFFIYMLPVQSYSESKVTFYGGISTPSIEMNKIYSSDNVNLNTTGTATALKLLQSGTSAGYHLGVRVKAPLNENLFFLGSFEWNKFSQTKLTIQDTMSKNLPWNLGANQNIIPISVGMQYYLIKEYIGLYVIGMINYNFFTSNAVFLDILTTYPDLNLQLNKQSSCVGISAGGGFEFDLWLLRPMVEFRYNLPNLVGKESGELTKTYYTLSIGFTF